MIKSFLLATTLLGLGAALAWSAPARAAGWAPAPMIPVVSSSGKTRLVFRNANDCAPFMAIAVWGQGPPTAMPLGYRCFDSSNGG